MADAEATKPTENAKPIEVSATARSSNEFRSRLPTQITEAEYSIVSLLLEKLLNNRANPREPETIIYTDSKLLVGHLKQDSKIRAKNLLPLYNEVALRLRSTGAKLVWVPRSESVKQLGH